MYENTNLTIMIDKKQLVIGNIVNTPQGVGIIKELRQNRAYLKFPKEKSLISFPYKDLSGIPLTTEVLGELGIDLMDESSSPLRNKPKEYYIISRDIDSFMVLTRDWREEPSWMLGIVYTDAPNEEENYVINNFLFEIKFAHQFQNLPWKSNPAGKIGDLSNIVVLKV